MENRKNIRNRIKVFLVFTFFTIPFALNSLHFIIYEHHSHCNNYYNISFIENNDTHDFCLYEFTSKIISENVKINNLKVSSNISFNIFLQEVLRNKTFRLFALRAPPIL